MLLLPYWRIADYICGAMQSVERNGRRGEQHEGASCDREVEVEPVFMRRAEA